MPNWLNPKRSKIILKANYKWVRPSDEVPVFLGVSVGPKVPGKTKSWLQSFAIERGVSIICIEPVREGKDYGEAQRTFGIGNQQFVDEVKQFVDNEYRILITR